jgi:hypothetical protein
VHVVLLEIRKGNQVKYILPDDYSRCWDDECPMREQCARWIQRYNGRHNYAPKNYTLATKKVKNGKAFNDYSYCPFQIEP